MANPVIDALLAQITRNNEVDASAVLLISGFKASLDTAVAQALANGATEAELAPVTEAVAAFSASTDALAAAVAAGTPGAPTEAQRAAKRANVTASGAPRR